MRQEAILRYVGAPDEDPPQNTTYEDGDRKGLVCCPQVWYNFRTNGNKKTVDLKNKTTVKSNISDLTWVM